MLPKGRYFAKSGHSHRIRLRGTVSVPERERDIEMGDGCWCVRLYLVVTEREREWVCVCVCERERVRVWELNEAFGDINEIKERKQMIESWNHLRGVLKAKANKHFWTWLPLIVFSKRTNPVYLLISTSILQKKCRLQTQIVRVEGEHADQLTNTTAYCYPYQTELPVVS